MKKLFFLLVLSVIIAAGCRTGKTTDITILGEATPYTNFPEVLNGKVKSVTEKSYKAVKDADSFKKGQLLTMADRAALGNWTDDYKVVFDADAHVASCTGFDAAGNPTWRNEGVKENGHIVRRNYFRKDSLRMYDKYTFGDNGFVIKCLRYRPVVDTLMFTINVATNSVGYATEYQTFNYKGVPAEKYLHTYDDQNKFLNFKMINRDGKLVYSSEVKYNDKGKVSEMTIRGSDGNALAVNYFTYDYDPKGNWIKAIVKDLKNNVVVEERSYTYFE